jgi:hypothetical protein
MGEKRFDDSDAARGAENNLKDFQTVIKPLRDELEAIYQRILYILHNEGSGIEKLNYEKKINHIEDLLKKGRNLYQSLKENLSGISGTTLEFEKDRFMPYFSQIYLVTEEERSYRPGGSDAPMTIREKANAILNELSNIEDGEPEELSQIRPLVPVLNKLLREAALWNGLALEWIRRLS